MRRLLISDRFKHLIKKSLYFILLFGTIKISSLFAALFSSNLVTNLDDYGLFEYALTFGGIASIIIDVGANGSYPYFYLKQGEESYDAMFYGHYLPLIGLGIVLFAALFFLNASIGILLCLIVTLILGMQAMISIIFKSKDLVFYSILADGGLFIVVNIYNIAVFATKRHFVLNELLAVLSLYTLLLSLYFIINYFKNRANFSLEKYKIVLKWGYKIVISSFLIIFLTSSARLIIENLLGLRDVAHYSFYFRLATMTVMLHQVINIFFFKKIYTSDPQLLDKYLSGFFLLIMFLGLLVWAIAPIVFHPFFKMLQHYTAEDRLLLLILCFQVYFWIVMATFENIIYREGLSSKMNFYFFFVAILFVGLPVLLKKMGVLDIPVICLINLVCLFLCAEIQLSCLKRKGIFFRRSRMVGYVILGVFSLIYVLLINTTRL